VSQLNAIGIVCADMRRSVAFYGLLGIEFPEGNGHVEATLPNGLRLMLDSEEVVRSFRPDWTRTAGNQLSLAFDGEKEPWDAFWGQRYAQLSDPDGVPVDLFAALSES